MQKVFLKVMKKEFINPENILILKPKTFPMQFHISLSSIVHCDFMFPSFGDLFNNSLDKSDKIRSYVEKLSLLTNNQAGDIPERRMAAPQIAPLRFLFLVGYG